MNSNYTIESLPNEMVVMVLSKLPLKHVLTVFETSFSVNQMFRPYFKNEITQAQRDHNTTVEALMKNIETEMEGVSRYLETVEPTILKPFLLSRQLTKIMGLGNFYVINGQAIYNWATLTLWWTIYARQGNLSREGLIWPDELMNSLFNSNHQPFIHPVLMTLLREHVDRQTSIDMTPELASALYREQQELSSILKRLRELKNMPQTH